MSSTDEYWIADLKNNEVLRKSFAHPLPKMFQNVHHLFSELEKVVAILHSRNAKITLNAVARNVMKNTKIKLDEHKLSELLGIYPNSYKLKWEKRRQMIGKASGSTGYDLVLVPNFANYQDLEPFLSELLNSRTTLRKVKSEPIEEGEERFLSDKSDITAKIAVKSPTKLVKKSNAEAVALSKYKLSAQQLSPTKRVAPPSSNAFEGSLEKSPRTPYTPMRRLNFNDAQDKSEPTFQLPQGPRNFVSPIKLISPTKKRSGGVDYIRKSPMKVPAIPVLREAQVDPAPKMLAWRKEVRRKIFRHNLVTIVKEHHEKFLQEKKASVSPNKFHPEFDFKIIELPRGNLPQKDDGEKPLRSALEFFENVKPVEPKEEVVESLLKSPSPVKKIPPIVLKKESSQRTPKISLLERIRAREAAKKVDADPEEAKEKSSLQVLNKCLVEVICSVFKLQKKHSMDVNDLMPVVIASYGHIDRGTFLQHIDALCKAAPDFCRKEILKKDIYLKISEARVDKIKQLVDERMAKLGVTV